MTLRENTSETAHRKYSVSQSGKYKSRPKIRPALSGDLFRPDVNDLAAKTNTIDLCDRQNREGSVSETDARGGSGNQKQQKQQTSNNNQSYVRQGRQPVPGEVLETAL